MLTKANDIKYPDAALQAAVEEELDWAIDLDPADIGVLVRDGVVTLSGEVNMLAERVAAYNATTRIHGVTAVADEIVVTGGDHDRASDTELAKRVQAVLSWTTSSSVSEGDLTAEVSDGVVTLTGTVEWEYQRRAVERSVRNLAHIRDVRNAIRLVPRASSTETARRIKDALVRNAALDAESMAVVAQGTTVTLSGTVRSLDEKREADRAAWNSPNVLKVVNKLDIRPI